MGDQGAGQDEQQRAASGKSAFIVAHPPDDPAQARPVEAYLLALVARCDDPPLIADLDADDLGTPRGTASIARAALCWLREGQPDAIRRDLLAELDVTDLLARWRIRQAGHDIRGDTDWSRVHEVATARAAYRERWGVSA